MIGKKQQSYHIAYIYLKEQQYQLILLLYSFKRI